MRGVLKMTYTPPKHRDIIQRGLYVFHRIYNRSGFQVVSHVDVFGIAVQCQENFFGSEFSTELFFYAVNGIPCLRAASAVIIFIKSFNGKTTLRIATSFRDK